VLYYKRTWETKRREKPLFIFSLLFNSQALPPLNLAPSITTLQGGGRGGGQGSRAAGAAEEEAARGAGRGKRGAGARLSARERACERVRACGGRAAVVRDRGGKGGSGRSSGRSQESPRVGFGFLRARLGKTELNWR